MIDVNRYSDRYGDEYLSEVNWLRGISGQIDTYKDLDDLGDIRNNELDRILLESFSISTVDRVRMFESLSYGDAGSLLFSSGPSLSGVILYEAGTDYQKEYFYNYIKKHKCRTFFAVTEPGKGSDASNLQSRLIDGKLYGDKWLVGNGAVGEIGVVIYKTGNGLLDTRAALIPPEHVSSEFVERKILKQYSLKGARLSHLSFNGMPILPEMTLGSHLNACERGLISMVRTFNKMRPCVVGLGLGYTQAVLDLIYDNIDSLSVTRSSCDSINSRLECIRQLNSLAARTADNDPTNTTYSSLAKIELDVLIKKMRPIIFKELSNMDDEIFDHVKKYFRDSYAFDFMEGTHIIQKNNLANGLKRSNYVANW